MLLMTAVMFANKVGGGAAVVLVAEVVGVARSAPGGPRAVHNREGPQRDTRESLFEFSL